jgi:hypothetical protein
LPLLGLVPVLVHGVAPLVQGVVAAPPFACGESLCGVEGEVVDGDVLDPVAPVVPVAPVEDVPDCEPIELPLMPVEPVDEPLPVAPVDEPVAPVDEDPMLLVPVLLPVVLLGVALSWVLDGVAGVEGDVVVVVLCFVVVVVLDGVWLLWSELVEPWDPRLLPDWLLVVSELVLCASASVPVKSRPAAKIDTFFI